MSKRYMVHPGYVGSKYDSDVHFITGEELIRLYNIDPTRTVIYNDQVRCTITKETYNKYTHLFPSYDGDYKIRRNK